MPGKTYKTRAVVLRKTKLAEKDLIVSALDESGALLKAVAKGARRPGGSLAARIELFSIVDLELASGRSLDVITGARLAGDRRIDASCMERTACASVLSEVLLAIAQPDLPHERLFAMSAAAFEALADADPTTALALSASASLKALAYAGFRPSFDTCVCCGNAIGLDGLPGAVAFAVSEGGSVCGSCPRPADAVGLDAETLRWSHALMRSRFDDVLSFDADAGTLFDVLRIVGQWTRVHAGKNLKSLDFLFSCGLF